MTNDFVSLTPPHNSTDPSVLGLRLYFKCFFITERESIFSYVHVEEEQVGEITMGLGKGGGGGEPDDGGRGMMLQRRQQSVGGVLRLAAAGDDDGDGGRDPLCLD